MKPKYDMLWKGIIEDIMEDLLLFVDPDIGNYLDLKRSFEFLDKELAEMYPEPDRPSSTRVVDKLVKVLKASLNPFAAVMLVAKEMLLKLKGTDEERDKVLLEQKILMVRLLKEKLAIFGEEKTKKILRFLNNFVGFKIPETNRKFGEKTDEIFGKKNTMGIDEVIAEIKYQEGLEEGKKKTVQLFLNNTDFSQAKIAELVGVPISLVRKIKKELNGK
jgi:hypothetical protein